MKKLLTLLLSANSFLLLAQTNPAITSWLQNTSITGRHYVEGNSTPIEDNVLANVQLVQYSTDWVYVSATGVPAYITGPFLDGNPSLTSDQDAIFKIPHNPTENTGTSTATNMGHIGVFINGVGLFDYADGVSWNNNTQSEGGGPIMGPPGQGIWNRDAVVAEREGFDCAKGHPAQGTYHHHQNPSAFNLDLVVLSDICNAYAADGLYVIDSNEHSPLIGFSFDGFPIYGAYGYENADGTGAIVRMKSGYQLRDITVRTHYADGTNVTDGPAVSATYPLGHYREDYEFVEHPGEEDYLDEHNGRWCVTPEYPNGIYAYFCTVDENHNSVYPYAVGPTFYGNKVASIVQNIPESTTTYTGSVGMGETDMSEMTLGIYPNPASEFVVIQVGDLVKANIPIEIFNAQGQLVESGTIAAGSTNYYLDTKRLYNGEYILKYKIDAQIGTKRFVIAH
ncbi:MAG: YHYH protein [Flavobacteriales bacterium]